MTNSRGSREWAYKLMGGGGLCIHLVVQLGDTHSSFAFYILSLLNDQLSKNLVQSCYLISVLSHHSVISLMLVQVLVAVMCNILQRAF